jgi:hypothetical protein
VADQPRHEVFLELSSGSRVLVGTDLPDVAAANAIARHWRQLAETMPGSGCIVRGSAIVAIKARPMAAPSRAQTLLGTAAPDGTWL